MMSKILLGLGLVFEMPMLIFFLARIGLVTARQLLRWFRWAVLAIFVVAAVITPTPDVATQTVFAVPMILLYLLGVGVAALFGRTRRTGVGRVSEEAGRLEPASAGWTARCGGLARPVVAASGGGRVAVAVSGGRDSLALAAAPARRGRQLQPTRRAWSACTCPSAGDGRASRLPEALHLGSSSAGVPVEEVAPLSPRRRPRADECSGVRSGVGGLARGRGAGPRLPTLALGHHADDVVETWLVSMLYSGTPEVLEPRRVYFDGA